MLPSKKNISLDTQRLKLKLASTKFVNEIVKYVILNKEEHKHAMPERMDFYYTHQGQMKISELEKEHAKQGKAYRFYIFEQNSSIAGDVLISDIKTGKIASCSIGIKISKGHLRKGYATEVLNEVIKFCFYALNVYRIEANILTDNDASISLFEKLGFQKEGISRAYLYTNGDWQDHLRYSLLKPEFKI